MSNRARLVPAWVALLTVVAAAFLWWQSERSQALLREQVLLQAEQRGVHLADAMAGQVSGMITTLDLQLRDLRREWLREPAGFNDVARGVVQALPPGFVTHISVVNAEGYVVYDSLATPTATFVGDRAHFQAQRDAATQDRLMISQPLESRMASGWVVVVNRPILRAGRFDGAMQMAVSTDFIARRLAALQLSGQDVVALLAPDGAFLARSLDHRGAMGARVPADRPFLTDRVARSGSYRASGLIDGIPRTYGWYRLNTSGLVVTTGIADEAVLAPLTPALRSSRQVTAALTLLLLLSGGLIIALLLHAGRKASALEASEVLRLRQFESSPLAMLVMDAATQRFVDCNAAALRIYGYPTREALLNQSPMDLSAKVQEGGESSVKKGFAFVEETRRSGAVVFEWRHKRPDGTLWDGEGHLMAFELHGRSLMQFTMQDITLRKRAEAALQESEARLKEAQRLARVGSWQRDLATNELSWSDEIFRIFELDASVRPTYKIFITHVHPDDRHLVTEAYQRSFDGRESYDLVHRLLMADGRVKHVRVSGFTEFDGDRALRSVGTVQDITEVHTAEEALKRLNEELELRVAERTREMSVLNRELEAFAYSVSHDLRTPLRSIDGFASLLEEECGAVLTEDGRNYVTRIRTSSRRMGRLISDLLTLAHLSSAELRREPVDLTRMAHSIVKELVGTAPGRSVQWRIDEGMQVTADPGLMRVVLQNLLGNAWKYTGQTPDAVVAFTHTVRADGGVNFCVRDNGAGFDMAYADQLFEPFKRLHAHHEFEGSGVGLATVRRVIERHGGQVSGEGVVGRGASFCFNLPDA
ncbi:sensor histidine kinase [Hydrogenophaga sp. PBL-H3]|uniref:sensor histidine kinase n=1 Tax=Hydrogenophaga sp. PBL-H3 TaxID=434010 RepID=UPI0013204F31|nr:sensor histidine kinase [Hydrogenophaga sp. PBL-H3]QHE78019.1 PAS domain S-box protein [Hydrogenophaga sp. PBL-H3]QHE82443.1 PAS domain S-box protein [Hydrogenophaga sp. PBL-H3]